MARWFQARRWFGSLEVLLAMVAPVAELRGVEMRWGARPVLAGVDLVLQPG